MSGYQATARIGRVAPRLVIGEIGLAGTRGSGAARRDAADAPFEIAPVVDDDPLVMKLTAIRDRWDQLTFYLFDAEGWR
jgi:hypothetical protein